MSLNSSQRAQVILTIQSQFMDNITSLRQFYLISTLVFTCLIPLNAQGGATIKAELDSISRSVVDLTAETDLLVNKEFLRLYRHPKPRAVLRVLGDSSIDEQRKIIAVLSMQNVSLHEYVKFLDQVAQLRQANRVSAVVFERTLFPGYMWSTKLEENYRDAQVVALLQKLKNSQLLDASQAKRVSNILNGKAKQHITAFRADQQVLRNHQ